ncbi:hypothetical protein BGZ83_008902, partial [Gryganskiella cystojenkinii]
MTAVERATELEDKTRLKGHGNDDTEDENNDEDEDIIDHMAFDQILEMDDEEDHEFSRSLVWNYFEQARLTFVDMNNA